MTLEKDINTESKIIKVAAELFAKNGFDGTSVRDICKSADANVSTISYYFGGKKELYKRIVDGIVEKILKYAMEKIDVQTIPENVDNLPIQLKVKMLFKTLETIIDYFYSNNISEAEIMIIFREQMTSGIPINSKGYLFFKKLLASILGKNENDKELIFRTITIVGQIHSARIFKQFSLDIMGQSNYEEEDIRLIKTIVIGQVKAVLKEFGVEV